MDLNRSISIIEGITEQFLNDRLHNTYVIENALNSLFNNEYITFKDYLNTLKFNDPILKNKLKMELKEKANKLKEKQDDLLNKLL